VETSETIKDLAAALAKAQGEIEGASKDKVNPAFKSKYADLSSVWEACRESLTKNGLSVVQSPGEMIDGKSMAMTTMLMHASGQWMRDRLTIPLGKVDPQGYGSAVTYARRYALAAFVGVAPEDDDGQAASKNPPANEGTKTTGAVVPKTPTLAERADRLEETLKAVENAPAVEKAWKLADGLRKDLDDKNPDRLAELTTLKDERLDALQTKEAA
jgi:hypothetical protein